MKIKKKLYTYRGPNKEVAIKKKLHTFQNMQKID